MDNNPLISIISPVYNSEDTIEKMIKSVLAQTYENFEFIIVDDVSSDSTPKLVKAYAERDSRIKFIQNAKNMGPGPAKNKAIRFSSGELMTFIDGDDWIECDMYSSLVDRMNKTKSDVVICGYDQDILDNDGNLKYSVEVIPPRLDGCENKADTFSLLDFSKVFSFCCIKLFKSSLIKDNEIEFPPIMHSEDFFFNMSVLPFICRTATVEKAYYHYIKPAHQTLTTSEYIPNYFELSNNRYESCKEFLISENAFFGEARSYISNTHIKHLFMCLLYNCSKKSGLNYKKRIEYIHSVLNHKNTLEAMEYCSNSSKAAKFMNTIFKTKSPFVISLFARLLWLAKYKLSSLFDKNK